MQQVDTLAQRRSSISPRTAVISLATVAGFAVAGFFLSQHLFLLQQCLNGLTFGSLVALIALGYTMVYGIIGLINFAHGDLFMLGAFLAASLIGWLGLENAGTVATIGGIALLLVVVPVYCACLNWTVDRLVYKPLRNAPKLAPLVSAIGVSFIFMNLGEFWGGPADKSFPGLVSGRNLLGDSTLQVTAKDLLLVGVVVPIMIGLTLLVKRTQMGRAMRATAQNPVAARLMGIDADRVIGATFLIGGGLGGVASVVYGLYINTIGFQMGYQNGLYAFTAAVLGGIGNIPGAVLGGLVIGLVRSLGSAFVGEKWSDAMIFGILILILVFKTLRIARRTNERKGMTAAPANNRTTRLWRPSAPVGELVLLAVLIGLPVVVGASFGDRLTDLFIFAILALGLNVVVGYTGLLHLGIGAFFGIGAYLAGISMVSTNPFHLSFTSSLLVATVGTGLAGLALGAPTLRLRGDYLALVTLGFGEVVKVALRNLEDITNGMQSLGPLPPPDVPPSIAPVLQFLNVGPDFSDYRLFYYLVLALLVGVVLLLRNLERSRLGRAWVALREDELAATCMAINVPRVKLSAFALSAALAGMAGCLYATKLTNTANPHAYGFPLSITALCCVILGGLGSIRGVLLGVLLLQGYEFIVSGLLDQWMQGVRDHLVDWLSRNFPATFSPRGSLIEKVQYLLTFSKWRYMVFGLVLILMVRFRPEGLLPSRRVQHELHGEG